MIATRCFFFVVWIFCLVQQHPLFICFSSTTVSASLFPSIPFLFQNQKTKKGVEIVPVAVKYWQTVSPRISMHLGLLLQRKGSLGLTAAVRWATHPVNQPKQTNLFKMQSRRETIGQGLRLISKTHLQHSTLNTRYPVLCRRPEGLLCLMVTRPLTRAAEHLHHWQQHGKATAATNFNGGFQFFFLRCVIPVVLVQ